MIDYTKRTATTQPAEKADYSRPDRARYVTIDVPEGQPVVLEKDDRIVLGTRRILRRVK